MIDTSPCDTEIYSPSFRSTFLTVIVRQNAGPLIVTHPTKDPAFTASLQARLMSEHLSDIFSPLVLRFSQYLLFSGGIRRVHHAIPRDKLPKLVAPEVAVAGESLPLAAPPGSVLTGGSQQRNSKWELGSDVLTPIEQIG